PFFDVVAAPEASVGGKREQPAIVVERALRAFEKGRSHVISGSGNYWTAQLARWLPRAVVARLTGQVMRPRRVSARASGGRRWSAAASVGRAVRCHVPALLARVEDEWLYGWDTTPGIVSVWAEQDGRALVWRRDPQTSQLLREEQAFRPWLLTDSIADFLHL